MAFFGAPSTAPTPTPTSTPNFAFGFNQNEPSGFTFGTAPPRDAPTPTPTPFTTKANKTAWPTSSATVTTPKAKRPASLADGVEGVVSFPSRGNVSYRFEIVAKDDKLHIWLEDRKTKKQWRTAQLALEDFVKDGLVIPQATFDDYAKCFLNCLESTTTNADFTRDLLAAADDANAWELQLTLQIRVFTSAWKPTYSFLLKPVPLEPVDLLSAKIRDQEDQIAALQRQVDSLAGQRKIEVATPAPPPAFVRGTLAAATSGGTLVWKTDEPMVLGKIAFHSSGAIRFVTGGTFAVNVMVQNTNSNNRTAVELLVNGKNVVSCVDSNANSQHHVSPICHVFTTTPDDEILVVYRGNNHAHVGSYIVIHELR